jgi:hypothetical protein
METQVKKDSSPKSKSDDASKKVVGQKPSEEAEKLPTEIPGTGKETDEKELFQISDKLSKKLNKLKKLIVDYSAKEKELKEEKQKLLSILARSPKFRRISRVLPAVQVLSPTERMEQRERLENVKTELIKIHDLKSQAEIEFKKTSGRSIIVTKRKRAIAKANSKTFTKKNPHLFKALLLTAINTYIANYPEAKKVSLRNLASGKDDRSKRLFKELFGDALYEIDLNAFLMCNGLLKDKLYESARLTLMGSNPRSKASIQKLVWPK